MDDMRAMRMLHELGMHSGDAGSHVGLPSSEPGVAHEEQDKIVEPLVHSGGLGAGSEFVSSIDGAPVLVAPARRPARPLRTLLVEDHPELGAATLDLLRGEGLEVIYVACGREALDAAAGVKPRILLCDMGLPDMEGLAVVDTLRPQLASWGTYVAMVTARTEGELRPYNKRARELGVDEFITKPITPDWVRNLIARLPAG
ncbi:MAG: response regulator [Pseudomonadota bacterium]